MAFLLLNILCITTLTDSSAFARSNGPAMSLTNTRRNSFDLIFNRQDQINSFDETGLTPLMQAVRDGYVEEITALIVKGAALNLKDSYGWTALNYAISSKPAVVKTLLDSWADVNSKDNRGITILMWASLTGDTQIVKFLLEKGAEINTETKDGATALSFAMAKGHKNISRLIRDSGGIGPQIDKAIVPKWIAPVDEIPRIQNFPKPEYSEEARKHGVQGTVHLRVLFGVDGKVKKVKVRMGVPYGLTEKAIKAAMKLRAKPAMNNGQAIEYWLPVEVEFKRGRQ